MRKLKFSLQPDTGTLSDQDAKRYFSAIGFATCAMMVAYFVSSLLLSLALLRWAPALLENPWSSNILSMIPLYGIAFPLFWLLLRRLPRDGVLPDCMGGKNWWSGLCVALALMMAGNYIGNLFIIAFEQALGRPLTNPVAEATVGQSVWINLIFVAVIAPILEELVFRKLLCDRLLPLGEGYTVVLSAVVFGLVHGNFFQFFYAFFLGALFAYVYIRTGRIRYTVIYHVLINLMGGVLAPWILEKLDPLMQEEQLNMLLELMQKGDTAGVATMMEPYLVPVFLLLAYELFTTVAAIAGIVILLRRTKRMRLQPGLLSPPRRGRVGNVLLNGGACAALTVFAVIFILSLL